MTGILAEGKSGKPNYQMESKDLQHTVAFDFLGRDFIKDGKEVQAFAKENLSSAFSITALKALWLVY